MSFLKLLDFYKHYICVTSSIEWTVYMHVQRERERESTESEFMFTLLTKFQPNVDEKHYRKRT